MKMTHFRFALLAISIATALSSGVTTAAAADKGRAYGGNNPFKIADLPTTSDLRKNLEKLPTTNRDKAMKWLNGMQFHTHDLPYLKTDKDGGIYYADTYRPATTTIPTTTTPTKSAITAADAFKLHSKAGSSKIIYLDFDGHTITNTAWNSNGNTLNALAYDLDGIAGFSDAESANIAEIWRRIAEDYAPFDVDVTTELPASFGANVGRIVITRDTDATGQAMPAQGAGGVAYVGVWGMSNYASYYSPALVYYNNLGNGQPDYVAEAASHEMGHNMGLSHDGTSTQSYYGGHGTGYISWGPIMGTGYYRNVSQWSKGEYTDANQTQDDVAIIASKVNTRTDDHGNQTNQATPLVVDASGNVISTTPVTDPANSSPANKGIISSRTDVDVFSFATTGGVVSLQAVPAREARYTRGGDLDIQLSLYDQTGTLLTSSNPTDDTNASISTTLAAGTYYLAIDGVGSVNYNDYGSLGQYNLQGTLPLNNDTTAPTPNPMGWVTPPQAIDYQSINMTAMTAIDDTSSVSYYFTCVSANTGCKDSGWITSPSYSLTGLAASTTYTFNVKARDSYGNTTQSSADASITTPAAPPVNKAPVAVADTASVVIGKSVTIPVLLNDADPDGDALTVSALGRPAKGTATRTSDLKQVVYTAGKKTGTDTFNYTISDGKGHTATAAISVTIKLR